MKKNLSKTEIIMLSKPKLKNPIFVEGLSNFGGIGSTVTRMLIEHIKAEKFAELYSPHFPAYAIAEDNGLCHLPRYEFYTSEGFKPNIIILTGETQPIPEDTIANYEIFNLIFNFAMDLGCKRFLSYGNFINNKVEREIFVVSTSEELSNTIIGKLGGKIFSKGRIDGLIGMILGLAKLQNLTGICLLGASSEDTPNETMTPLVFKYLLRVLEIEEI